MLIKGNNVPKIYWVLVISSFLWLVYNNIFSSSQWERYGFSEAEDYGLLILDIVFYLLESFYYMLIIWLCVSVLKKLFSNN